MADNKVMINPNYKSSKKRIEEEEKELEELMKQATGKVEVEEEKPTEEPEEKPEPELSGEEKTFKKRYGDLRRHLAQKEKEWEEKLAALETRREGIRPPKSDEDIEQWAKKYPDVASIVETIAKKKAEEMFSRAESRFKELDEMQYETKRKSAEQQIREAHEDFDTLKDSDDFHEWAEEQPQWVQNALYENEDDARSVIRVIDLYKVDKGLTKTQRKEAVKEAAKAVKTKTTVNVDPDEGAKKIYESKVAKMSDKEYEQAEPAILEAMRNGNFVYDLTGGAR